MTPDKAKEQLAELLYLKMERLDPSGRGLWSALEKSEREFYRASIEEVLLEKELISIASGKG